MSINIFRDLKAFTYFYTLLKHFREILSLIFRQFILIKFPEFFRKVGKDKIQNTCGVFLRIFGISSKIFQENFFKFTKFKKIFSNVSNKLPKVSEEFYKISRKYLIYSTLGNLTLIISKILVVTKKISKTLLKIHQKFFDSKIFIILELPNLHVLNSVNKKFQLGFRN